MFFLIYIEIIILNNFSKNKKEYKYMIFFDTLLQLYSNINFPNQYTELSKIDRAISWYYGDSTEQYVTLSKTKNNNIIEIDISQAFPTICRCIFKPDDDFIINMNKIQDKKTRNIFISTSLVNTEYLRILNIICKMIIMGVLFEFEDVILMELKKDGAIISCNDETLVKLLNIHKSQSNKFSKMLIENNFHFHFIEYDKYIRSNRTSYFWSDNELKIKGMFKHVPKKLMEIQKNILEEVSVDYQKLIHIYSERYFKIVTINNLTQILKDYYLCNNNRYLTDTNKYMVKTDMINPRNYIKTFLFPIILSTKI